MYIRSRARVCASERGEGRLGVRVEWRQITSNADSKSRRRLMPLHWRLRSEVKIKCF